MKLCRHHHDLPDEPCPLCVREAEAARVLLNTPFCNLGLDCLCKSIGRECDPFCDHYQKKVADNEEEKENIW